MKNLKQFKEMAFNSICEDLRSDFIKFIEDDQDNQKLILKDFEDLIEGFLNSIDLNDMIHNIADFMADKADYYLMSTDGSAIEDGFYYFKRDYGIDLDDLSLINMIEKSVYYIINQYLLSDCDFNDYLLDLKNEIIDLFNDELNEVIIDLYDDFKYDNDLDDDDLVNNEDLKDLFLLDDFDIDYIDNVFTNIRLTKKLKEKGTSKKINKL